MPGAFREQLRVGGADEGAVGDTEIVQLLRSEEMAQQIEVSMVLT